MFLDGLGTTRPARGGLGTCALRVGPENVRRVLCVVGPPELPGTVEEDVAGVVAGVVVCRIELLGPSRGAQVGVQVEYVAVDVAPEPEVPLRAGSYWKEDVAGRKCGDKLSSFSSLVEAMPR
jgi:hypothetical protein